MDEFFGGAGHVLDRDEFDLEGGEFGLDAEEGFDFGIVEGGFELFGGAVQFVAEVVEAEAEAAVEGGEEGFGGDGGGGGGGVGEVHGGLLWVRGEVVRWGRGSFGVWRLAFAFAFAFVLGCFSARRGE